jgi:ribosomal protein L37E
MRACRSALPLHCSASAAASAAVASGVLIAHVLCHRCSRSQDTLVYRAPAEQRVVHAGNLLHSLQAGTVFAVRQDRCARCDFDKQAQTKQLRREAAITVQCACVLCSAVVCRLIDVNSAADTSK